MAAISSAGPCSEHIIVIQKLILKCQERLSVLLIAFRLANRKDPAQDHQYYYPAPWLGDHACHPDSFVAVSQKPSQEQH